MQPMSQLREILPNMSEDVASLNPQLAGSPDKPKRPKFLSNKCEYQGRIYDSEWEARYATELDLRLKAGDIFGWSAQFPVSLRDGTRMVADFLVVNNDGTAEIHSCKSKATKTPLYRRQVKEFKALYPDVEFREIVKPDWRKK